MSIHRRELKTTNFKAVTTGRKLPAVHPGAVLQADFIDTMGITRYRVAKAIGVQQRRIDEICSGDRAVTADTAYRLGLAFGVDAQFWLNLQGQYDLEVIERDQGKGIAETVQPLAA